MHDTGKLKLYHTVHKISVCCKHRSQKCVVLINVIESTKFAVADVTICQEPGKHHSHGAVCPQVLPCTDRINSELTTGNWIDKLTCDVVVDVYCRL